jgi:flavodoxin
VQIVYFSGTGGTSRVVLKFEKIFSEKGIQVVKIPLDMQEAGCQEVLKYLYKLGLTHLQAVPIIFLSLI